jgi:hypothetical protein
MAIRYYLHGDQHESDSSKFYCRACDTFSPESHFPEHDTLLLRRKNNYQILADSRKTWKVIQKQIPRYHRPSGITNLFVYVP